MSIFFSPIFIRNERAAEKDGTARLCGELSLRRCEWLLTELTVISGHRAAVASETPALGLAAQGFYCFR